MKAIITPPKIGNVPRVLSVGACRHGKIIRESQDRYKCSCCGKDITPLLLMLSKLEPLDHIGRGGVKLVQAFGTTEP
jgi:transposase-like protein